MSLLGDGTVYWKSLADLRAECRGSDTRQHEFLEPMPWKSATPFLGDTTRRDFLALMGFTLGAAACSRAPVQHALPFVNAPEELTPGVANWYATACGACPAGCGLLVKTRDGRPIKVEGNPESPLSRGGTCAVGQATVLSLYDGERLRQPVWQGQPVSWADVDERIAQRLDAPRPGSRVVLLSAAITSPTTREVIRRWSDRYPGFQHITYEAISCAAIRRAYDQLRASHRPALPLRSSCARARPRGRLSRHVDLSGRIHVPVLPTTTARAGDGASRALRVRVVPDGRERGCALRRRTVGDRARGVGAAGSPARRGVAGRRRRGPSRGDVGHRCAGQRTPTPSRRVPRRLRRPGRCGSDHCCGAELPAGEHRPDRRRRASFAAEPG